MTIAPVKGGDWYTTISDSAHGRAYATWSVFGGGTDTRVYVSSSADDGATWSAPVWIARDKAAWMSNIRVDGSGRLWVEYTHFDYDLDAAALECGDKRVVLGLHGRDVGGVLALEVPVLGEVAVRADRFDALRRIDDLHLDAGTVHEDGADVADVV